MKELIENKIVNFKQLQLPVTGFFCILSLALNFVPLLTTGWNTALPSIIQLGIFGVDGILVIILFGGHQSNSAKWFSRLCIVIAVIAGYLFARSALPASHNNILPGNICAFLLPQFIYDGWKQFKILNLDSQEEQSNVKYAVENDPQIFVSDGNTSESKQLAAPVRSIVEDLPILTKDSLNRQLVKMRQAEKARYDVELKNKLAQASHSITVKLTTRFDKEKLQAREEEKKRSELENRSLLNKEIKKSVLEQELFWQKKMDDKLKLETERLQALSSIELKKTIENLNASHQEEKIKLHDRIAEEERNRATELLEKEISIIRKELKINHDLDVQTSVEIRKEKIEAEYGEKYTQSIAIIKEQLNSEHAEKLASEINALQAKTFNNLREVEENERFNMQEKFREFREEVESEEKIKFEQRANKFSEEYTNNLEEQKRAYDQKIVTQNALSNDVLNKTTEEYEQKLTNQQQHFEKIIQEQSASSQRWVAAAGEFEKQLRNQQIQYEKEFADRKTNYQKSLTNELEQCRASESYNFQLKLRDAIEKIKATEQRSYEQLLNQKLQEMHVFEKDQFNQLNVQLEQQQLQDQLRHANHIADLQTKLEIVSKSEENFKEQLEKQELLFNQQLKKEIDQYVMEQEAAYETKLKSEIDRLKTENPDIVSINMEETDERTLQKKSTVEQKPNSEFLKPIQSVNYFEESPDVEEQVVLSNKPADVRENVKKSIKYKTNNGDNPNLWFYKPATSTNSPRITLDGVMVHLQLVLADDKEMRSDFKFSVLSALTMKTGEMFDYFINTKARAKILNIDFFGTPAAPIGWKFYVKGLMGFSERELNPERSLKENKIRELGVLIARQVLL